MKESKTWSGHLCVRCPHCNIVLGVREHYITRAKGTTKKCGKCGKMFRLK